MNAKTLLLLVGATGVAAAGAALALKNRESAVTVAQETGRFFPDLIDAINDVSSIDVQTADASFSLERTNDGWTLANKGGYPAEAEPVRKLLIGVAELNKLEPKTDNPERWFKLGVEDVAPEATSKKVTLEDASGNQLASLLVGKPRASQGGRRIKQLYVRRAGDNQSWLVEGEVDIKATGKDWLQKEIYSIPQSRIQAIEIEHADGEILRVLKGSEDAPNFDVLDVPAEQELRYPTIANPMAGGVSRISLDDVQKDGEVDFESDWLSRTTVRTFDGLTLRITLKDVEGTNYTTFAASYEPPATPPEPAPEPEQGPEQEGAPVAEVEAVPPSPEEIQAEADELNARFAGWTFVVPQYNRTTMTKRMSDMVKEPPPPEDALGTDDRPLVIPDTLPPEIQEQIKAHQDSLGNKTVVRSPDEASGEESATDDSGDGN